MAVWLSGSITTFTLQKPIINLMTTHSLSTPWPKTPISKSTDSFIKIEDLTPTAKHLIKSKAKQFTFHLLPKVHKIHTPGRPTGSVCSCPTENISEYLDSLNPYPSITKTRPTHSASLNRWTQQKPFNHSFFSPWMWYLCTPPSLTGMGWGLCPFMTTVHLKPTTPLPPP